MDYHSDSENPYDLDYGDYEDIGTPMASKVSWLSRKLGRIDSVRSNHSLSSSSTYIYGSRLTKKPIHKSQISLYEKISRKFSLFDGHKAESRSRKSSRQRSVSDTTKPNGEDLDGVENKAYENEKEEDANDFNIDVQLDKKLLETISENQNSPYSTQASHNTSRRMSAQSIFAETTRRGSLQKVEPFAAPVIEMFNENEFEETNEILTKHSDSLTGSKRSRESGVGSLAEADLESSSKEVNADAEIPLEAADIALNSEISQDSAINLDNEHKNQTNPSNLNSQTEKRVVNMSEGHSPSPLIPRRYEASGLFFKLSSP